MSSEPEYTNSKDTSLDYVHDRIKELVYYQAGRISKLDSKATGVVILDVAAVALIVDRTKLFTDYYYLGVIIMLAFCVSILFGLWTILFVQIDIPPKPVTLWNDYLDEKETITKQNVTYSLVKAYAFNEIQWKKKRNKYQISVLALITAIILLVPSLFVIS